MDDAFLGDATVPLRFPSSRERCVVITSRRDGSRGVVSPGVLRPGARVCYVC
jgi:hypothetical protein